MTWDNGFSALAGVRYDTIDMESRQPVDKLLLASSNNFCAPPDDSCVRVAAADRFGGFSWTLSISYDSRPGLIPYATVSRQSTVIAGQGAEITTDNIAGGGAFDVSRLHEIGLKGSLLNNSLYFALSFYEQQRTDFSAQATVTNQASQTEGAEFEMRWVASEKLLFTLGYSDMEVVNLNTLEAGSRFSFIGSADDIPGVAPEAIYGGTLGGAVIRPGRQGARRAGMPRNIASLTATYDFGNGVGGQRQRRRRGCRPLGVLQLRDVARLYAHQRRPGCRGGELDIQRGGQEPDRRTLFQGELPESLRRRHRAARTAAQLPGSRTVSLVGGRYGTTAYAVSARPPSAVRGRSNARTAGWPR